MIYFSLSHCFNQFDINQILSQLTFDHPEFFIYKNVCIPRVDVTFPFFYWSKNNCNNFRFSPIPSREQISTYLRRSLNLAIDCGNPLLEMSDYLDIRSNAFLEELGSGSNATVVSTPQMLSFIKAQYPSYHVVGSELFSDYDPTGEYWPQLDTIRTFTQNCNNEFFAQIPKSKVELCVCSTCFNCENYEKCAMQECQSRLLFSEQSTFLQCPSRSLQCLTSGEIWEYIKQGYTHFYYDFSGIEPNDTTTIISIYLDTLIKDEYRDEVYAILKKELEYV